MTLGNIMLSVISQTQKGQIYTLMIPLDVRRISTFTETGRVMNLLEAGERRNRELLSNSFGISVQHGKTQFCKWSDEGCPRW